MMKKQIILLFSFFIVTTISAQKIIFPESFKFDQSIFKGMAFTKINDKLRKVHIFKNPAVITDQMDIKRMADRMDPENITKVYYEIYADGSAGGDAGVMVFEFNSVKNLKKVIPDLQEQSNYVVLTADKYLIQIWNDSRDTENRLRKSVDYYKNKVNAKQVVLKPFENSDQIDSVAAVVEEAAAVTVSAVGDPNVQFDIGFGSIAEELLSENEGRKLQNYARKFNDNYQIEIAVSNIGNSDLTEDMIPGYASHLVFNNKESINNNIVILFDEVQNKSYFFFGKQNGKILKKLPLEQLKKDLNAEIAKGKIYQGINSVLEKFEIALIEASGQKTSVRGK